MLHTVSNINVRYMSDCKMDLLDFVCVGALCPRLQFFNHVELFHGLNKY